MNKQYKQYYTVVIESGNDRGVDTYSFNTLIEAEDFYDSMLLSYGLGNTVYSSLTLNRVIKEDLNG